MISQANLKDRCILVISDSDRLSKAIKVNLERRVGAQIVSANSRAGWDSTGHDLIIVALSSSTSEPIVALARAAMVSRVGQVPLLIISDHPFEPDLEHHIQHLDFPFDADQLYDAVNSILNGGPAAITLQDSGSVM